MRAILAVVMLLSSAVMLFWAWSAKAEDAQTYAIVIDRGYSGNFEVMDRGLSLEMCGALIAGVAARKRVPIPSDMVFICAPEEVGLPPSGAQLEGVY